MTDDSLSGRAQIWAASRTGISGIASSVIVPSVTTFAVLAVNSTRHRERGDRR